MVNNKRVGLALSGGGYRAAAYHLGTLKKLHELGILEKVDVISAVSGGSIIAASYGLHQGDFKSFEDTFKKKLNTSIIKEVITSKRFGIITFLFLIFFGFTIWLLFTKVAWLSYILLILALAVIFKYQFKIFPISEINERVYNKLFYQSSTLSDLCEVPLIAINTTNLDTGRPFTFSHSKMSDSTYEYPAKDKPKVDFVPENFPVSRAVASSTCVPFAFTPVTIDKAYFKDASAFGSIKPMLIDGGVYDNQGIHKITQPKSSYECDIIIISDAGNNMPEVSLFQNTIGLLIRTSDVFMNRIKNFQMSFHLYNDNNLNKKEMAFQSLGWDHDNCIKGCVNGIINGHLVQSTIDAHGILKEEIQATGKSLIEERLKRNLQYESLTKLFPTEEETKLARSVSTNLTSLSEKEILALSKHAEVLTEIQIKLYCPSLFK